MRAQAVAQQRPGAGHFLQVDAARLAKAQVHAHDPAHAAGLTHHIHWEVIEGAAVAQQVTVHQHRRQRTGDGNAGQHTLQQRAVAQHLFSGLRIVAGDAVAVLPQVFDVGQAAEEFLRGGGDDAAQPLAGDQAHQRQQVEVARGVGAEGAARHVQHFGHGPVGCHQRCHHRADAGAADKIHLDALLLQRLQDAQVRQPARTAARQHQADGVAALDACQPRHVARQRGADVDVVTDRAPRQPVAGALWAAQVGRVQQHQDLGRFGAAGAGHQELRFGEVQRGGLGGVGQQQHLVAAAAAAARPGCGFVVGQQQHVFMRGLDLVQVQRDAAVGVCGLRRIGGFAARDAGQAKVPVHPRRVHQAHAGCGHQALQLCRQVAGKNLQVHARGDGQEPDGHRPRQF